MESTSSLRDIRILTVLLLTAILPAGTFSQTKSPTVEPGNETCGACHTEIYKSYSMTIMAGASGSASDGIITGEFHHQKSGVRYRIYIQEDRAHMSFDRESEYGFHGQRELLYFIGSGRKGRTYLFSVQGFLFEAPINWYSQEARWNMAPAYTEAHESPMNLPSVVDCLNCHASSLQPTLPGTDNKYAGRPFLHNGITCERCHASGEGHKDGKGMIVNPAKLSPERRDSICMECHFEGSVGIKQPGARLDQFQPGDRLSDYIHYFLLVGNQPQTSQALSQFEALSLSVCKRNSGDKMSCTSCHDPHKDPSAAEKAAFYRGKCLNCHGEAFAARHHPDHFDCTQCHMPSLPSKDVAHTQSTDHRILRYPHVRQLPPVAPVPHLVPFPASEASQITTRDLALAWETMAQRNVEGASREADQYLRKAVKERPDDPLLLSALGYEDHQHKREKEARALYERALQLDSLANDAAVNLGVLEAQSGHLQRAVQLWQSAFDRVPYRSAVGVDLAMAFCSTGQTDVARNYVLRVLDFNPDFTDAKRLLTHLNSHPEQCKP